MCELGLAPNPCTCLHDSVSRGVSQPLKRAKKKEKKKEKKKMMKKKKWTQNKKMHAHVNR